MAGMTWITDWILNQIVDPDDQNRIEGNCEAMEAEIDAIEADLGTKEGLEAAEDVQVQTADSGSSDALARADHLHDVGVDAAEPETSLAATGDDGSSAALARADHRHPMSVSGPGNTAPGDSASTGSSSHVSRADHRHGHTDYGNVSGKIAQGGRIRVGNASTGSVASGYDKVVSFGHTFPSTPVVTCTSTSGCTTDVIYRIVAVSTTGFTVELRTVSGASLVGNFGWIAAVSN